MRILRRDGSLCAELKEDRAGNLTGAFLYEADLAGALLDGIGLSGAELGGANLRDASLQTADLYWAACAAADFTRANLRGVDFRGAVMKKAVLRDTTLDGANFGLDNVGGRTQLQGADLSGASVLCASFDGALYDDGTIFPEKFNPHDHGMVKAPEGNT